MLPVFQLLFTLVAMVAGIEGSDDDALVTGEQDEELSRWEQEQIRKGINIPQVRPKGYVTYYTSEEKPLLVYSVKAETLHIEHLPK